jgi:D-glycero-alpha-D-manno-heptose-7-phosphate kinase
LAQPPHPQKFWIGVLCSPTLHALLPQLSEMIISRTPFRISFFGGGSDYPEWSSQHGGAVLSTAIDKYCYLTCRYLPPFFEHRYRIVYSHIEMTRRISDIKHPAVRGAFEHLGISRGMEIHHDGDLPARSGMGSSSSFAVGILHALHALQGRIRSKEQLASEAIFLEQQVLKGPRVFKDLLELQVQQVLKVPRAQLVRMERR